MMTQKFNRMLCLISGLLLITLSIGLGRAQSGSQGTISVTVVDATGGVVPGTTLTLVDQATNDARNGATHENGTYTFVNLNVGNYKLTAEHGGYSTSVLDLIAVHAALTTDLTVTLKVGAQAETVTVN